MKISRRNSKPIPKVSLIQDNNKLSAMFINVL